MRADFLDTWAEVPDAGDGGADFPDTGAEFLDTTAEF